MLSDQEEHLQDIMLSNVEEADEQKLIQAVHAVQDFHKTNDNVVLMAIATFSIIP